MKSNKSAQHFSFSHAYMFPNMIRAASLGLLSMLLPFVGPKAQGTLSDQYKQMGGIAAIAEICYGSKQIPNLLNQKIKVTLEKSHSTTTSDVMRSLVSEYNNSYKKAVIDQKIWNGSQQSYSKTAFSCQNTNDMDMIKKFESTILINLK